MFYRGDAKGEESPIRIIQGPKTKLDYPDTTALDAIHDEVFVPQRRTNSIFVFRRDVGGDVAPIRIIHGPKTKLDNPRRAAVDPQSNLLVVTNGGKLPGILLFNRTDEGDAAPRAMIAGQKTGLGVPGSKDHSGQANSVRLYPEGGKIVVSFSANDPEGDGNSFIGVWKYTDNGDVPPWAIIKGTATKLSRPFGGVALNPEEKEIIVADNDRNALLIYYFPQVFE